MATVLTIAGAVVDEVLTRTYPVRVALSLDDHDELEFVEYGPSIVPRWAVGSTAELALDGTPRFKGEIVSCRPRFGVRGWEYAYHCLGLRHLAAQLPVTNPHDFSGEMVFNRPYGSQGYVQADAVLSVGTILARVLDGHAAALAAIGVAGYLPADLTPLVVVPPEPVIFRGPLMNAMERFLADWSGAYAFAFEWQSSTSNWKLRVLNTLTFTPVDILLDQDGVEPVEVDRDSTHVFTAVVVRGMGDIEPGDLSLSEGQLAPTWTAPEQAAWTIRDFEAPEGFTDAGAVVAMTSTSITINPDDNAKAWPVNFWSTAGGWIAAFNPATVDLGHQEWRWVSSNAALTAGGNCALAVVPNWTTTGYTRYRMVANPPATMSDVWRRYDIVPVWIKEHLAAEFPLPVPWVVAGTQELITYPASLITAGGTGVPYKFEVDRENGQIVFARPVVELNNQRPALEQGGDAVKPPDDVRVMVPYARGTLSVRRPASGFEGTGYTRDGIAKTRTIDVPAWRDKGEAARVGDLAQMYLDTMKDTVLRGAVRIHGKRADLLAFGKAVNIKATLCPYATGLESAAIPIRGMSLSYPDGGPDDWVTEIRLSSQRQPWTGEALFLPQPFLEADRGEGFLAYGEGLAVEGLGAAASPVEGLTGVMDTFGPELAGMGGGATGAAGMVGGIGADLAGGMAGGATEAAGAMTAGAEEMAGMMPAPIPAEAATDGE